MNRRTAIKSIAAGVALNVLAPWNMAFGGARESRTWPNWHVITESVKMKQPGVNPISDRIPEIVIGLGQKAHDALHQARTPDPGISFYSSMNSEGSMELREYLDKRIGTVEPALLVADSTDTLSLRELEFWKKQFSPSTCDAIILGDENLEENLKTHLETDLRGVFYFEENLDNTYEPSTASLLLDGLCAQNEAIISLSYFSAITSINFGGCCARCSTTFLPSNCDKHAALAIDTIFHSLLTDRTSVALIWIQCEPSMSLSDFSWFTTEIRRQVDKHMSDRHTLVDVSVLTNKNLTDKNCRYMTVALA